MCVVVSVCTVCKAKILSLDKPGTNRVGVTDTNLESDLMRRRLGHLCPTWSVVNAIHPHGSGDDVTETSGANRVRAHSFKEY